MTRVCQRLGEEGRCYSPLPIRSNKKKNWGREGEERSKKREPRIQKEFCLVHYACSSIELRPGRYRRRKKTHPPWFSSTVSEQCEKGKDHILVHGMSGKSSCREVRKSGVNQQVHEYEQRLLLSAVNTYPGKSGFPPAS